jgi:SET domain-containing protein
MLSEYTGEVIDGDEAVRRNQFARYRFGKFILKVTGDVFLDGSRHGNQSRYINHSCKPNCYVSRRPPRAFIVSQRMLGAGEEVTIDYDFGPEFHERCSCGTPRCRGYM